MLDQKMFQPLPADPLGIEVQDQQVTEEPSDPGSQAQLACRYRTLQCMCLGLRPFEVIKILLREGADPNGILEAIGQMDDRALARVELLLGLWLYCPGLKDFRRHTLELGIHPVSLPLFLPGMAPHLLRVSEGVSKGVSACRMNDLVLSLADTFGVRDELRNFQQGGPPGYQQREVNFEGPESSRLLLPGLKFCHSITIQGDPTLEVIPSGIEVGGSFTVRDCPYLRSVPSDLRTGRHLHLQMVPCLQGVPEALEVMGNLVITGPGRLGALPWRIRCEGDLRLEVDLADPGGMDDLQVKGSTLISAENLVSLPRDTHIGGKLQLIDCPHLQALPEGLQVGGDLVIRGCPSLIEVGSRLQVGGSVHLEIPSPLWNRLTPGTELGNRWVVSHADRLRI